MKKIIFLLVLFLSCFNMGFAQKIPTSPGEICDVRFMDGRWKKYIIFEFRDDGIVGLEFDVERQRHFIDRDEIERIFCNGEYYEFPERKVGGNNYGEILKYAEKRRDPALAGILSFVFVGGGQFYNDQAGKGFGFITFQVIIAGFVLSREDPGAMILILPVIPIWSMVDAIDSANEINDRFKLRYNISFRPERKRISCGLTLNF